MLVYWKYDYRHTCTLNSAIGVNYLRKDVYQQSNKLKQKLNGQQLELTIEQVPGSFAIVDKGDVFLLILRLDKYYVEPDFKDINVSYKLSRNGVETKSGKMNIESVQKKGNRFLPVVERCHIRISRKIYAYLTEMSHTIVNKLIAEL